MSTRALLIVPSILVTLTATVASAQRADMRFRGMDRNGDGVVTRDEWRGSAQSFRVHDWNGDGVLSGDEVAPDAGFATLDRNRDGAVTPDEWRFDTASFHRTDRNGDGRITREELLGTDRDDDRTARSDDPTVDLFRSLDANRDRRVTQDEWHWSLDSFRAHDANHDGVLTRSELNNAPAPASDRATDTPAYRAGYARGLAEGRTAGHEDKAVNGGRWDLDGQRELERADSGYSANVGPLNEYQGGYRAGFRAGYREGFGPR